MAKCTEASYRVLFHFFLSQKVGYPGVNSLYMMDMITAILVVTGIYIISVFLAFLCLKLSPEKSDDVDVVLCLLPIYNIAVILVHVIESLERWINKGKSDVN